METIIDFFNTILDNLHDLPDNSDTYWERILSWLTILYFEIKLQILEIAWSIASTIISTLQLSETIEAGWSMIDSEVLAALTFLRIPESINMILSAFMTRFVMGLMP